MNGDALLPAIAAGDPDAFAHWVAAAEPRLRASLRSFAACCDTEAVLQECLLRLWQVAPRVQTHPRGDTLVRLGIRVARNLALNETRRLGVAVPPPDPEAQQVEPVTPDPMLRQVIATCREKLPRKPAMALDARLRLGGSHSDHDLSQELGMKLNTFLQNFTRARKLLAACLENHGVELQTELS